MVEMLREIASLHPNPPLLHVGEGMHSGNLTFDANWRSLKSSVRMNILQVISHMCFMPVTPLM